MGLQLRSALAPLGIELHFETGAVGSYQMTHIAAAIEIRPLTIGAFTIPTYGGVTVTPTNMPEANNTAIPVSWPGTFAGIPSILSKSAGSATWTFTHSYTGTATAVAAGTGFIPSGAIEFQDGVTFLNLGKNHADGQHLLQLRPSGRPHREGIALLRRGRPPRARIRHYQNKTWVPGTGGFERIEAYNKWCKDRYGARFLDVQAYISSAQIWTDTGITPTAADLAAHLPAEAPPSLAADNLHLNSAGNGAVAT